MPRGRTPLVTNLLVPGMAKLHEVAPPQGSLACPVCLEVNIYSELTALTWGESCFVVKAMLRHVTLDRARESPALPKPMQTTLALGFRHTHLKGTTCHPRSVTPPFWPQSQMSSCSYTSGYPTPTNKLLSGLRQAWVLDEPSSLCR